ncbi:pyrimidine-nucleoside phosphorylase [Erysipelotrichaceae bacterium OttesenSCG-928-M19]|nr:pyrimidine-nucleoside phosphorylase [Erysipelotrichaceae bacterium OttesenSCG-928-M19]
MNIIDIIEKKRDGYHLDEAEIDYFIKGYLGDEIADYQISALLMAIVLQGMDERETALLTKAMMNSGAIIDLSAIAGIKCDKHSTGGVGDKVSLVLAPLLTSAGVKVAKMSGRGLGHTGGTLDKLEAIPNFNINLSTTEFINQVNEIGIAIIGQTTNLVPADKKLYALRDVTGTVQSIPLIASSIMSKKLASGSDAILLDVKVGDGAFMKDLHSATILAQTMVNIGKQLNKDIKAVITDMNQPLGYSIGNNLEVIEAIATLHGQGPKDLEEICLSLGSLMLVQAQKASNTKEAYDILKTNLTNESAFLKFIELVAAQNGDTSYLTNPDKFAKANNIKPIYSKNEGYLKEINALKMGHLSLELGAGRKTKEDQIDYSAGIVLTKKIGNYVRKNEIIAYLHSNKTITEAHCLMMDEGLIYQDESIAQVELIKKII